MGLRKISGPLIKQQRGKRTIEDIIQAAGNKFTKGAMSAWENDKYLPEDANIIALCRALGCEYEDISVEVTAESVAA